MRTAPLGSTTAEAVAYKMIRNCQSFASQFKSIQLKIQWKKEQKKIASDSHIPLI